MVKVLNALVSALSVFVLSGSLSVAEETASQAYLAIHEKELKATCYDDLLALRAKSAIANDKPMTKEESAQIFPIFKMLLPKAVKVLQEDVTGDSAVLTVEEVRLENSKPGNAYANIGKINLLKENGQWKLEKESWKAKGDVH